MMKNLANKLVKKLIEKKLTISFPGIGDGINWRQKITTKKTQNITRSA